MSTEDGRPSTPAGSGVIDETGHGGNRRMSHFKEYKFFRSFSAKVENWPMRKAEALWRRMRERKIAGERLMFMRLARIIFDKLFYELIKYLHIKYSFVKVRIDVFFLEKSSLRFHYLRVFKIKTNFIIFIICVDCIKRLIT